MPNYTWLSVWSQVLSQLLLEERCLSCRPRLGSMVRPPKMVSLSSLRVPQLPPCASLSSSYPNQQNLFQYPLFKCIPFSLHSSPQQSSAKAHIWTGSETNPHWHPTSMGNPCLYWWGNNCCLLPCQNHSQHALFSFYVPLLNFITLVYF